jgi:two-component system, chemotaxis family, chemotaxis protein CheY
MPSRVLIVDDHPGFRGEARTLLEAAGYEIVGEVATATAAPEAAASLQPDLVILDIGLPDGSGLDATAAIRAAAPRTAVVLVSVRPATDYGRRLTESGATGFISKAELSAAAIDRVIRRS